MSDELFLALGRLEGKMDSIITTMAVHDEELRRLETRIRTLEQSRSYFLGAAALAGAAASFLLSYFK